MFGNYLMDKKGMRISLILVSILMIIGTFTKLLINSNIWFVVIGNGIAGMGRLVIINGSVKTANKWFFPKNTPIVISIIVATMPLGVICGYFIPIMYVNSNPLTSPLTEKDNVSDLLLLEA